MSKVWKSTGFALLAALLLCTAPDWSGAQEADPNEPLKLKDGKIRIAGVARDVPLEHLIELYVEATGRVLVYDPKRVRNARVEFFAPVKGKTVSPEGALRVALVQYRMALVKHGKFDELVSALEAVSYAPTVTEADLSTRHPLEFVRVVVHFAHADANHMRGLLQNMTSRHGGQVNPLIQRGETGEIEISALVICDEAANVRDLLKMIKLLDKPRKIVEPSKD